MLATFTVGEIAIDSLSTLGDPARHTLRSAINAANNEAENPGHDTILIPSQFAGQSIELTLGSLNITSPLSIFGPTGKVTIKPKFATSNEEYGLNFNVGGSSSADFVVDDLIIDGFTSGVRVQNMPSAARLVVQLSKLVDNDGTFVSGQLVGGAGIEIRSGARVLLNTNEFSSNNRLAYGFGIRQAPTKLLSRTTTFS